jgi:hypothetical protein
MLPSKAAPNVVHLRNKAVTKHSKNRCVTPCKSQGGLYIMFSQNEKCPG